MVFRKFFRFFFQNSFSLPVFFFEKSTFFWFFCQKYVFFGNHSFYVVYQLLYKQFHHLICFQIQHKMVFYIFQGITSWFPLDSWFWTLLDFLSKLLVKVPKLNCLDSEGLVPEIIYLFRELWLADRIRAVVESRTYIRKISTILLGPINIGFRHVRLWNSTRAQIKEFVSISKNIILRVASKVKNHKYMA